MIFTKAVSILTIGRFYSLQTIKNCELRECSSQIRYFDVAIQFRLNSLGVDTLNSANCRKR